MTISANTVWEVRTTGNDTQCGGGFDATIAGAGTDYSQQNSAQATGTVTSSTTTVTATTGIFTAAMVGNSITDGTTYKQITGYTSATVVTVDSAPAWTSATVYVGGALASPGKTAGLTTAGNTVYIKTGIYLVTTASANVLNGCVSITAAGTAARPNFWRGYTTARGDASGAKPVLKASGITNATLVSLTGTYTRFENMELDGNTLTSITTLTSNANEVLIRNGTFRNGTNNGLNLSGRCEVYNSAIIACGSGGTYAVLLGQPASLYNCTLDACSNDLNVAGTTGGSFIDHCLFRNHVSGGAVVNFNGCIGTRITYCTFYNNSADNINLGNNNNTVTFCLFVSSGGYGINGTVAGNGVNSLIYYCAGYANTSSNYNTALTNVVGFVPLTTNPFNNASGGDFSLNNLAGGGALCRAAGLPGAFPGLPNTARYQDIGAVQHSDPIKIRGRLGDGR